MNKVSGGLDNTKCPNFPRPCKCKGLCCWCGYRKHTGIHGTVLGDTTGRPYGHQYEARKDGLDGAPK